MSEFNRDLDADEALCNAATPGPWWWHIRPIDKCVRLSGIGVRGEQHVLDPRRWGMNGATICFLKDRLMWNPAKNGRPFEGREHHSHWIQAFDHPDAAFIAAARSALPAYIAEVRRLRAELAKTESIDQLERWVAEDKGRTFWIDQECAHPPGYFRCCLLSSHEYPTDDPECVAPTIADAVNGALRSAATDEIRKEATR